MKNPEDKLEKLFQEKLSDHKEEVNERVWKGVERRVAPSRIKRGYFWWFIGSLLFGLLALGTWGLLTESEGDDEGGRIARSIEGKDDEMASEKTEGEGESQEEKGSKAASEEGGEKGSSAPTSEGPSGRKGASEAGAMDSTERGRVPEGSDKGKEEATKGNEKGVEKEVEGTAVREGRKDVATKSENREGEGAWNEESDGGEKEAGSTGSEDPRKERSEREKGSAASKGSEEAEGERRKEQDEKAGNASSEGSEREKRAGEGGEVSEEMAKMERIVPDPDPRDPDSLPSLGAEPEKIELSKGSQALDHFHVGLVGSYGESFRALSPSGSPDLVSFRNENEAAIMSWSYGIEGGAVWENGLGFSLGLEGNSYGNSYSFEGSETLHDTSYSTETQYNYTDSTYVQYDSLNGQWDTITVVVDSTPYQQTDTTVTSTDSSYTQEFKTRYRYFSVPLTFSYEIGIGDRFSIVPEAGVGLNFLVRSHVGWSEPESHEEVRMQYPSEDPFRSFALSFRGSLHFRYRFSGPWELGAGVRYSRFLHSVYTDEVPFEERPYRYGGVFELRYLLGAD